MSGKTFAYGSTKKRNFEQRKGFLSGAIFSITAVTRGVHLYALQNNPAIS
jgi:hypothetical protein